MSGIPKENLTKAQRATYIAIAGFIERMGWAPSVREVVSMIGVGSTRTAWRYMHALSKKGYILIGGKHRQLRVLRELS